MVDREHESRGSDPEADDTPVEDALSDASGDTAKTPSDDDPTAEPTQAVDPDAEDES